MGSMREQAYISLTLEHMSHRLKSYYFVELMSYKAISKMCIKNNIKKLNNLQLHYKHMTEGPKAITLPAKAKDLK